MNRLEILEFIANQSKETLMISGITITCPCGTIRPHHRMIRCLYCTIYFCEPCAHDHFTNDNSIMSDLAKERWWREYKERFG